MVCCFALDESDGSRDIDGGGERVGVWEWEWEVDRKWGVFNSCGGLWERFRTREQERIKIGSSSSARIMLCLRCLCHSHAPYLC